MTFEASFDLDGDLIFVDAIAVGPSGRAAVRLVLDTGAVLTTLIPPIAESIGYSASIGIAPTVTRTATAVEHGYIVRLVELTALGFTLPNAAIDVANLGHDIDGVLGMSFLLDFNFEIRPSERRILIEKITP